MFGTELKIVITLPLQTVSIASDWFTSSADRVAGYEHRVMWKDGTIDSTPAVSYQAIVNNNGIYTKIIQLSTKKIF